MKRCCENCVNFYYNNIAQWGKCYLHIKHCDGVEKIYSSTLYGKTIKEHICQFYKRKGTSKWLLVRTK